MATRVRFPLRSLRLSDRTCARLCLIPISATPSSGPDAFVVRRVARCSDRGNVYSQGPPTAASVTLPLQDGSVVNFGMGGNHLSLSPRFLFALRQRQTIAAAAIPRGPKGASLRSNLSVASCATGGPSRKGPNPDKPCSSIPTPHLRIAPFILDLGSYCPNILT